MTKTWLENPVVGAPASIIVEVAQAHEGSLGMAHSYIDAAKAAGASAIKFQTHIAEAESSPDEPWRTRFSTQDDTRFEYWKRMEFAPSQWHELAAHAKEAELVFMSSPFSLEAVELLEEVGVGAWKVASGEISNTPLLDAMCASRKPVLISTGMSAWPEIDEAIARIQASGAPVAVFQCTSAYPCPPQKLGLNVLSEMRQRYPGVGIGLSDHSGTPFAGLGAAAIGIELLEVHLTFHQGMFGPDVPSSLVPDQLSMMIEGIRFLETAHAHPTDKSEVPADVAELRSIFMKSVVATQDLSAGRVLEAGDLKGKKPGTGIPVAKLTELIGRRLARDVAAGALLEASDLTETSS